MSKLASDDKHNVCVKDRLRMGSEMFSIDLLLSIRVAGRQRDACAHFVKLQELQVTNTKASKQS